MDVTVEERPVARGASPGKAPASARRRRGRPYRLPADPTPLNAATPGLRQRTAWLLGVSRVHSTDPDLARRDRFIDRLKDQGIVLDSTRLSRWESGRMPVSRAVVTAYERVLGLAPAQLTVGVTALVPASQAPLGSPRHEDLDPEAIHERLDALFATVLRGGAEGHVWLELCDLLTQDEHIYLLPQTWAQVSDLLARELGRSTGLAYLARFTAQRMLVTSHSSSRAAVRAINEIVTSPATDFVIHPLSLLQEVDDPQAIDLLLRLLHEGPSFRRSGAAWAVAGKLADGRLTADLLTRAEATTLDILRMGASTMHRLDALDLFVHLPPASRSRVARAVHDDELRASLEQVTALGEVSDPETARSVSARIAATVQERTHTDHTVEPDPMLERLVREALFHVSHARRHQAALLLAVSPYRAQLGGPLLELTARNDEVTAVSAMTAVTHIADADQRSILMRGAVADPRPAVRLSSLMALGQVVGSLSRAEADLLEQARPASGPLRDATTYVLGIGAAGTLAGMGDGHGPQAEAARWWGGTGAIAEPLLRS